MHQRAFLCLTALTALAHPLAAQEFLCLEAERFGKVDAEVRNFGGVVGVVFPKKDSSIRTSFVLPRPVQAELWARVYFPWGGQDAIALNLDAQRFTLSARTATGGGRWDIGNFQVWHWTKAGTVTIQAGKHELSLAPAKGAGQRVDRVVLYGGTEPAWTRPWLEGSFEGTRPAVQWRRGDFLAIPAAEFGEIAANIEPLGDQRVAVLRRDDSQIQTVFETRRAARARLWARVYFDAKNMFEGLTMQEMATNLYMSLDGELLKTVFEQNGRLWHWVATDEPVELASGRHLITLQHQGLPVKVDQVVVYAGEDATAEAWFRSPPPQESPFVVSLPKVARAGNWRIQSLADLEATFLGERDGPARFPVKLRFGPLAVASLVRVAGLADNPSRGDPAPAQQVGLWVKNPGPQSCFWAHYNDRRGETFIQELHPQGHALGGWQLFSADIPLRRVDGGTFFDRTGEAADAPATPLADAEAEASGDSEILLHAGRGRYGMPEFPIEVRALSFHSVNPGKKEPCEVVIGEPFLESPFTLQVRVTRQAEGGKGPGKPPEGGTPNEAAFEIEVHNQSEVGRKTSVLYRLGDFQADPLDASMRTALLQRREVSVPARGKGAMAVPLKAPHPGIFFLECRVGQDEPLRRLVAFGKPWQERLAALQQQWEREAGAFRFSPDGSDKPLKKADGTPLMAEEVAAAYGAAKGLALLDDGLDVCSLAYAAKRDFAYPLQPRGWDLSDEAGWPRIAVPNGVLAIDARLGRFKFAGADPRKMALRSTVETGFGVPGPPVTVRGRFAYVGPGEGHYSVVDCADKTQPRVVSQIRSWYFSHKLIPFRRPPKGGTPNAEYAYFESSHRGLILVDDLSNPYVPGPLRSVQFDRSKYGRLIHVFEEEAVGCSDGGKEPGLWFFDLSDPLYPREIAKVAGASSLHVDAASCRVLKRLEAASTMASRSQAFTYVGDTVRALDVSNPRKPRLLPGAIAREKWTRDKRTEMAGIFAVSLDHLALRVEKRIDVYRYAASRELSAEKVASLPVPEKSGPHVFGAFHRGLLHVIDGKEGPGQYSLGAKSSASRWFVFQVGQGKAEQVGLYEHPWPSAFGNITIAGDTGYVADYNYGLWLFDLSESDVGQASRLPAGKMPAPRTPKRLGGAVTAGESDALWLDGDRAYQWQTFGGAVFLLDVADPGNPKRLGEYWDGAWLPYGNSRRGNNTVAGKDGFLYVPRQDRGLLVVDVRDAAKPKAVGEFKDSEGKPLLRINGECIDVWGDRAFVLPRVSAPAGGYSEGPPAYPPAGQEPRGREQLRGREVLLIYDVSRPAEPRLLSSSAIPPADCLCARGDRLYLGHAKGEFSIVDVADAAKPAVLASLDLAPYCPAKMSEVISGLAVAKGHAYLTARGAGEQGSNFLHIVDVRNPRQPRWVTTYDPRPDLPDSPCSRWADFYQDIIADGDYLFIGDYGEIQCLDISEPEAPRLHDALHVGYQWSVGRKRGPHLFVPALAGLLVLRAPSSSQAPIGKVEAKASLQ